MTIPLVGKSTQINIFVNGKPTVALLDSGSQVTTVARWYMDLEIPEVNIQGIEQFLQITVASGSSLEYYGVAELELEFPELELKDSFPTPVIVVIDTE